MTNLFRECCDFIVKFDGFISDFEPYLLLLYLRCLLRGGGRHLLHALLLELDELWPRSERRRHTHSGHLKDE